MTLDELSSLNTWVLWAAFAVSAVFGVVAKTVRFCTMGAIGDIVNMGDWSRMRMWGMAVGVAILGFYGMAGLGWIDPSRAFYTNGRVVWLSALVGGALFGAGMVLGSGCGGRTLLRIGSGSLKALVVFVVMGVVALASLRGITAVLRVNTFDTVAFDLAAGAGLPALLASALGTDSRTSGLWVAGLLGGGGVLWALYGTAPERRADVGWGGLGVGLCVVAMWWVSGVLGFVPEHPQTLDAVFLASNSGRMESLTFTAPMAYTLDWFIYFSDASKYLTLGVVSVAGVIAGSLLHALLTRSFHWEGFRDTRDTALHLSGAALMGFGGVLAMGCSVGQGLSGLSTLSLSSMIAVVGIVLGALSGFRFQVWLLMRD